MLAADHRRTPVRPGADKGLPTWPVPIQESDNAGFEAAGIPTGGLFTGAETLKTPEQAALFGGIAGEQLDPCYHLACDTYDNVNLSALDVNADIAAGAILSWALDAEAVTGEKSKKNPRPDVPRPPQAGPTAALQ
jgi:Zn-dependent M28 family amino/carboxypeptidase